MFIGIGAINLEYQEQGRWFKAWSAAVKGYPRWCWLTLLCWGTQCLSLPHGNIVGNPSKKTPNVCLLILDDYYDDALYYRYIHIDSIWSAFLLFQMINMCGILNVLWICIDTKWALLTTLTSHSQILLFSYFFVCHENYVFFLKMYIISFIYNKTNNQNSFTIDWKELIWCWPRQRTWHGNNKKYWKLFKLFAYIIKVII